MLNRVRLGPLPDRHRAAGGRPGLGGLLLRTHGECAAGAAGGADDSLTLIEDQHVAEMDQRDFDQLVARTGLLRYRVGDTYDPHAAVERHASWTAEIRARID
jgi:hypothetical protein